MVVPVREKAGHAVSTVTNAFSSWENFKKAIEVKDTLAVNEAQAEYENADPRWMNEDLEPTPFEKRTWDFKTYCLYYFGLSFGNWSLGSTMVGIGLNWWQAILVIFAATTISATASSFNSRCSATYHLGYPAITRAVFGMYGSFYFVGARAALAVVWYGVQLYTGASYLSNMLRAIFGDHYKNIPNHIPEAVGITTSKMLAFFLFWLIHLGFCFFRPYQLKKFFWFKGAIMLPAVFGVFIYCMIETKGKVGGKLPQSTPGVSLGWFIMHAINSGMGNSATLITNQPDIARWSKTRHAAGVTPLMVQPFAVTLSASLGILATAAINQKWDLELWNPWDLLDAIQDHHGNSGARFAIFLAATTWTVGILGTNIAANMIAFGADVALLWPRYIDMKRGFFLVQFLGYAIVPWKILKSASVFTTFLSGYGLFMASVVAIMLGEYYLLSKGNLLVPYLFDPTAANPHYRYHRGWNVQAVIAYLMGVALPFPGFVASLGAQGVNQAGNDLFYLGWLLSFSVSLVMYPLICKLWPTTNQKLLRAQAMGWEEAARMRLEGLEGTVVQEVGPAGMQELSEGSMDKKTATVV